MKTAIQINLDNPCGENFKSFEKTSSGGHCPSCHKEVVDFSIMTNTEVLSFLNLKSKNLCGRFKGSQLNRPLPIRSQSLLRKTIGIASILVLSLASIPEVEAQSPEENPTTISTLQTNYIVKGTVLDDQNLPLAGVNVVLKGSNEGVVTDFDGKFQFSRQLEEGDVLVFSYIGYDTKEFKIKASESKEVEVAIQFEPSDVILMGEVSIDEVYSSKKKKVKKFTSIFKK